MTSPRGRRSLGALVGAALLVTACGDDGDDSQSVASSPNVTFLTTPENTAQTRSPAPPLTADQVTFAPFVSDLASPVDLAWRGGDDVLYVALQGGTIVPVRGGVAGAPVLDISGSVTSGVEQGLLGLAFHPSEPLAYVNYTDANGDTVIAEYSVTDDGTFDASTARELLTIDQPHANHNGGNLEFGPDGYLYIGMGDGGSGGDPDRRSLNLSELLGKMLTSTRRRLATSRTASPPTIRSLASMGRGRRSGQPACEIRGASPSIRPPVICGLATLAKASGKRSTSPVPSTAEAAV